MRRVIFFLTACFMTAAALVACTALGVEAPKTCHESVAVTIASITGVRDASTAALTAKKIAVADKENLEKQADAAREGATIARGLCDADPKAAMSRLDIAKAALTAINAYLLQAQGGK